MKYFLRNERENKFDLVYKSRVCTSLATRTQVRVQAMRLARQSTNVTCSLLHLVVVEGVPKLGTLFYFSFTTSCPRRVLCPNHMASLG